MPFFTSNGVKVGNTGSVDITTYTPGDYYIASDTGKQKWKINGIENSIDTTINKEEEGKKTGPNDYANYYSRTPAAKLFIRHLPTGYSVSFAAILESYNESFKPTFNPEQVYGRMDPIQKYQSTTRTIGVSWKAVAYDEDHAHRNLHALSALAEFLYPVYDKVGKDCSNAIAIRESPLLRIRFANLIQRNGIRGNSSGIDNYIENGLLVAPSSFEFNPSLEAGFFFHDDVHLFPKEIKISMNFSVLHEETPGWLKPQNKYHWIGKLKESQDENGKKTLKVSNTATDFPWGNDRTEQSSNPASAVNAAATTSGDPATQDEEFNIPPAGSFEPFQEE